MKRLRSVRRGFTLIELLVVIAIIGILATITMIGYRIIKVRAEDTQRKTDLKSISTVIEAYGIEHNEKFPLSASGEGLGKFCPTTTSKVMPVLEESFGSCGAVPTDKKRSITDSYRYYHYLTSSDAMTYWLQGKLMSSSSNPYFGYTYSSGADGSTSGSMDKLVVASDDTMAPTFVNVGMLIIEKTGPKTLNFSWTKAVDNSGGSITYTVNYSASGVPSTVGASVVNTLTATVTLPDVKKYTFRINAADESGNVNKTQGPSSTFDLGSPDNTAPVWPSGAVFTVAPQGYNRVIVNWTRIDYSASGDPTMYGGGGYILYYQMNGGDVNKIKRPYLSSTYTMYSVPIGTYNFWIKAIDNAGNLSTEMRRDGVVVTGRTGDLELPIWMATIVTPIVNGNDYVISWADAYDNVAIRNYGYSIDMMTYVDSTGAICATDEDWINDGYCSRKQINGMTTGSTAQLVLSKDNIRTLGVGDPASEFSDAAQAAGMSWSLRLWAYDTNGNSTGMYGYYFTLPPPTYHE